MDDKRIMDYSSAMERIQAVTGCGTQRELGRFLGINQSAISDAKRRAHFFEPHLRGNACPCSAMRCGLNMKTCSDAPCGQRIQHTQRD